MRATLRSRPVVPSAVDRELMAATELAVGFSTRGEEDLRRAGRDGFWDALAEAAAASTADSIQDDQ